MTPAIQTLMNEHRLIEKVLGSLETFVDDGGVTRPEARRDLARFVGFFRTFADKVHHGKEEDRLFVKMIERGFPREGGPIAVMLAEHVEGRLHVGALAVIGAGSGALTAEEQKQVIRHARSFISLLREHIQKEDGILYPMAERFIPGEEMDGLADAFVAFEAEQGGTDGPAKYRRLADELAAEFAPDAAKMMAAAGHGCGARR